MSGLLFRTTAKHAPEHVGERITAFRTRRRIKRPLRRGAPGIQLCNLICRPYFTEVARARWHHIGLGREEPILALIAGLGFLRDLRAKILIACPLAQLGSQPSRPINIQVIVAAAGVIGTSKLFAGAQAHSGVNLKCHSKSLVGIGSTRSGGHCPLEAAGIARK